MSKKYRSDAMAAIHETMEALHDVGAIDKQTMRRFDDACLTPIRPLKAEEIKAIREREHVSQTVFANYLNVTSGLVSKWERGEERPSALTAYAKMFASSTPGSTSIVVDVSPVEGAHRPEAILTYTKSHRIARRI
jgi:putative transcriptional regulator